jgi:hypothetical protein
MASSVTAKSRSKATVQEDSKLRLCDSGDSRIERRNRLDVTFFTQDIFRFARATGGTGFCSGGLTAAYVKTVFRF